jgi:hypothetical protein
VDEENSNMSLRTRIATCIALSLTLGLSGCTTFYMVKDPTSGSEYYTTKVKKSHNAVIFKDAKTSAEVTLESSQVLEITKDQYQAAVNPH